LTFHMQTHSFDDFASMCSSVSRRTSNSTSSCLGLAT